MAGGQKTKRLSNSCILLIGKFYVNIYIFMFIFIVVFSSFNLIRDEFCSRLITMVVELKHILGLRKPFVIFALFFVSIFKSM